MANNNQPIRQLADAIFDIDRRLTGVERTPQLSNSSLEDTGINVYDSENNLTVTVGKQPDGTYGATPVRGPVPPAPEGVDAEGDASVVRASWDGSFRDEAAKPLDFAAVEVLVDGVVRGALHDPLGGSVTVPAVSGDRVVSFRTLSQAGMHSDAVGHMTVTVEPRVSEQMLALGEDLAELNDVVLPELADDLEDARTDLQQKLDTTNQRIDDIIVDGGGGAGNFTTYSVNEPSGEGTGAGDQWFRVVNGEVLGQWQWDGQTWAPVTLTDAVIAGIDLSKIVSNGNLSEVVASKIFTDIFTANKITSQEIAAGSITTEKIAAEGIIADKIQGGSFTGETFEGGEFVGGAFRTSEAEPGEVLISDTAFCSPPTVVGDPDVVTNVYGPGIRITPEDSSNFEIMPSIGPTGSSMAITGGKSTSGNHTVATVNPTGFTTVYNNTNGEKRSESYVSSSGAGFRYRPYSGAQSNILTYLNAAVLETEANPYNFGRIKAQIGQVQISAAKANPAYESNITLSSLGADIETSTQEGRSSLTVNPKKISLSRSPEGGDISLVEMNDSGIDISLYDSPGGYKGVRKAGVSVTDYEVSLTHGEPRDAGRATMYAKKDIASLGVNKNNISASNTGIDIYSTDTNNVRRGQVQVTDNGVASILASDGTTTRGLEVNNSGVWAKQDSEAVSLIPQVRPFQYSAQWNADQSPAPIMVQHLPGGKLCQAQIRIQNLSGSALALPYDTWVTVNYNPIPTDLRGGYTDYIEVTLPQLNARGRVEMSYSTGRIRVKALEKDTTISWTNNSSIWFPMRWFSPDSASL